MAATRTCKRHPSIETRLSCSNCDDPICARCAVASAVGQKCPSCAKQERSARALGKPRQYAKGGAAGVGAALLGAIVLWAVIGVGFLTIIASLGIGYGIGRAVRWGAEGNAARPFVALAVALAVLAVEAAWLGRGVLLPIGNVFALLTYPAAGYGAYMPFR